MEPISIKLPRELIKLLDKRAKDSERSRPQQIRLILKEYFNKNGTKRDDFA